MCHFLFMEQNLPATRFVDANRSFLNKSRGCLLVFVAKML